MHNNLIILAGGMSSRMKKAATSNNVSEKDIKEANQKTKGLIGVGNNDRPILDYLLYNAKKSGYQNIYIIVNEMGLSMFQENYGSQMKENNFNGLSISYVIQYIPSDRKKPLGTADALDQTFEQYPELTTSGFTVCNSDNLYSVEALEKLRVTDANNAFVNYDRSSLVFPEERISRFSVTQLTSDNFLENIVEKPTHTEVEESKDAQGNVGVSMNIFKFTGSDCCSYMKNCPIHPERNEKEIPVAVLNMVKDNIQVKALPMSEHVPDLTAKDDIAVVRAYLQKYYAVLDWEALS